MATALILSDAVAFLLREISKKFLAVYFNKEGKHIRRVDKMPQNQ